MQKHFVTFYSPGTIMAETNSEPIESWDVAVACDRARAVRQRHGATPYGFAFTTRGRGEDDLDSKEVARSPFYWLGGTVETLDEIVKRADPNDRILISNMRGNGWGRVITNTNSWKTTRPLLDGDVVLEWAP